MTITPEDAEAMVALAKRLRAKKAAVGFYSLEPNVIATKYGDDALTTEAADAIAALADLREADRAEIERLTADLKALNREWSKQHERAENAEARLTALEADRVTVAETALRMAAEGCDRQAETFSTDEYAVGQPLSSFSERFACAQVKTAILAITPTAVLAAMDSSCNAP